MMKVNREGVEPSRLCFTDIAYCPDSTDSCEEDTGFEPVELLHPTL